MSAIYNSLSKAGGRQLRGVEAFPGSEEELGLRAGERGVGAEKIVAGQRFNKGLAHQGVPSGRFQYALRTKNNGTVKKKMLTRCRECRRNDEERCF
ncbi:hypothetical protein NDU88_005652 [Pleurodeles waltl]|uniref:Uncharacterized protein n=1 Tax=Pleurodeles waltl TaxID=8319 RepID=A0AAV7QIW4_PLEWA|nr:hypothetical protein NDU88_005652 [Pleurodeles waltl]